MRQMFTCPLKDTSKESIEAAYREIWAAASAMGFCTMQDEEGQIKRDRNNNLHLDVPLYTSDESKLIV